MHPERNVETPRKERRNPQAASGVIGARLSPCLICSEPVWFSWIHSGLFCCPSATSYTFILKKPQADMEILLFFKAPFHLLWERLLHIKELKRYSESLSLPSLLQLSHLFVFCLVIPGCTDTSGNQKTTSRLNRTSSLKY